MGYENLNSTKLLAAVCACCGRLLRDEESANIGIGPDCREKYGYNEGEEANRDEANGLIYQIADAKSPATDAVTALARLREIGFGKLALSLSEGFCPVRIERHYDMFVVKEWKRVQLPRTEGGQQVIWC